MTDIVVVESEKVPVGRIISIGGTHVYAHPVTALEFRCGGRTPFWTRHMLGVREAERDRRRAS